MHRSRKFLSAVLMTLFLFVFSFGTVPAANAEDVSTTDWSGEPTDPQRIIAYLQEMGIDLNALGINVSSPLEALLDALRFLGLIPPEESDQ